MSLAKGGQVTCAKRENRLGEEHGNLKICQIEWRRWKHESIIMAVGHMPLDMYSCCNEYPAQRIGTLPTQLMPGRRVLTRGYMAFEQTAVSAYSGSRLPFG